MTHSQSNSQSMSRAAVMNFLNEVASRFPRATSFASGRPAQQFFQFREMLAGTEAFVQHFALGRGLPLEAAWPLLAQYGPTNGIINDLVTKQLANDHGIDCPAQRILITGGCQEALSLLVQVLCREATDVILVRSPCYVGMTGAADIHQVELAAFHCDNLSSPVQAIAASAREVAKQGKKARLLYLVPDFDNPTGAVLTRRDREQIIEYCAANEIIVLEDNPYGMFRYEGADVPSMFSLDPHGCVIFLGTYSKTLCPSLRIGFAALPPQLFGRPGTGLTLLEKLSQAKSFVTVNTGQLAQAVVGSVLLAQDCSLRQRIAGAVALYRNNRDHMVRSLARYLGMHASVSWSVPEGGFFLTVHLPFPFGEHEVNTCAQDYGVLVLPLSFFALDKSQDCSIRLAFSNVGHDDITRGIERLGAFVAVRLGRRGALDEQTTDRMRK